jgi:hypothetical protein
MADGTKIPFTDIVLRGRVFNTSDAPVLCWVQDNEPEIYQLGPNRSSPPDRDVDFVKAVSPATLKGFTQWFKIWSYATAVITGKTPDLHIHTEGMPVQFKKTDAEILAASGTGATSLAKFMKSTPNWGQPITAAELV